MPAGSLADLFHRLRLRSRRLNSGDIELFMPFLQIIFAAFLHPFARRWRSRGCALNGGSLGLILGLLFLFRISLGDDLFCRKLVLTQRQGRGSVCFLLCWWVQRENLLKFALVKLVLMDSLHPFELLHFIMNPEFRLLRHHFISFLNC